jgi:tol-pal system protein YbgF
MRRYTLLPVIIMMLTVTLMPGISSADTADENLKALENRVDSIQKTYLKNNQQVAAALSQSSAAKEEFGKLKGRIDANHHLIGEQNDALMRQITGLDNRIQAIEDRMAIFSAQLTKALGKVSPSAAKEGELYQEGLDLIEQSKYLEAAAVFETFIVKYPKSQFVPNARFWIGECFYSSRDLKRSIKEYQVFIEKHRKHEKIPNALLKQGDSFNELGMPDEAKAFYQKVVKDYPNTKAAGLAQSKIKRLNEKKAEALAPGSKLGAYPTQTLEQRRARIIGSKQEKKAPATKKNAQPSGVRDF